MNAAVKVIYFIALIILIIGGINWGLLGLYNFDIIATILGATSILTLWAYLLVSVCAIIVAIGQFLIFNKK